MQMTSVNNRKRSTVPAVLRNDNGGLGANAVYDRDDYVFLRAQTRAMQLMEWENRLKPIRHWGSNIVADLAWTIFA